jgi:hypothetical protein
MKMSAAVLVGAFGAMAAAMVLASPLDTGTETAPTKVPNRAVAYLIATCDTPTLATVSQASGWHSAYGSKRVQDRALLLAGSGPDQTGCDAMQG